MNTQAKSAKFSTGSAHPMWLAAAASVTALSLAGVATLAGWLPGPSYHSAERNEVARLEQPASAAQPPATPVSIPQPAALSQDKEQTATHNASVASKPAARATARHDAPSERNSTPASGGPVTAVSSKIPAIPAEPYYSASAAKPAICKDCGTVEAVNEVKVEGKASGGGGVVGGVIGGIVGNQIGKGTTRDIATVIGAVGGAYAGNHIEKKTKESTRYDVVVRFEDGSSRTFSSETPPVWRDGDRVRLYNGALTSRERDARDTAGTATRAGSV